MTSSPTKRVFWPEREPPTGPVVFWRASDGWEVRYVPEADVRRLEAKLRELRSELAAPIHDAREGTP